MRRVVLPSREHTSLTAGQWVLLSGTVYTARDQAHKRMLTGEMPLNLKGQAIYYAGPCPAPPGQISGPIGPTTSSRMDPFTPDLLKYGVKVMIGKGERSETVISAIKEYQGVYLVTVGGAGTFIAQRIKKIEVVAYSDLGSEAIHKLEIEDLPALVAIDSRGDSIFQQRHRSCQNSIFEECIK